MSLSVIFSLFGSPLSLLDIARSYKGCTMVIGSALGRSLCRTNLTSTISGETEAAKWGAGGGWWGGGAQEFRSWQEESKEWR